MKCRFIPFIKIILVLLIVFIFTTVCLSTSTFANVTIQSMIDEADPNDVVIIPQGIYEESILITKPIKIYGNGVIIKNQTRESAISVLSNEVTLRGLSVYHENSNTENPALYLNGDHNKISDLYINSSGTSIQLVNANNNKLENLKIERDQPHNYGQTSIGNRYGNGIDLYASDHNIIKNNILINQLDGIYIESSNGNIVEENEVKQSRYGFHIMFADETVINNNQASLNTTGSMIMGSSNVEITNNKLFKQFVHVHSQGLLLYDVHKSKIQGNFFSENLIGVFVHRSSENQIFENSFTANLIGFQIIRSEGHEIFHNDFFTNVVQARGIDSVENSVRENFWDTHAGLDFTGNGISEISFRSDPVFLSIIERKPPYQILTQSPGIQFLQLLFDMNNLTILKDTSPLIEPFSERIDHKSNPILNLVFFFSLMVGAATIIIGGYRK